MAIAQAINGGTDAHTLYDLILDWAAAMQIDPLLRETIQLAAYSPPTDYLQHMGWVLTALHNALWQLLHAPSLEKGVVDTIMRGGDTDTNAAICGALLGVVYGIEAIPDQWREKILNCCPRAGTLGVHQPRPEVFWPVDALELAEALVTVR